MPAVTDPAFLLVFGLDESLPGAIRVNAGSLGSGYDLSVVQGSGSDGIPSVADGSGGKAADFFVTRTGYTTAYRCLRSSQRNGSGHAAAPARPLTSADDDFAFGVRFQYNGGNTGGGTNEDEALWGLRSVSSPTTTAWSLALGPDDASSPTASRLRIRMMGTSLNDTPDVSGYTKTGSPPSFPFIIGRWYRVVVRVFYNGSTGYLIKIYVYEESTGVSYTYTRTAAITTESDTSSFQAATDVAVHVGVIPVSTLFSLYGTLVDTSWLFDSPMSDGDATTIVTGGFTVPWTPPSYRRAAHDVYGISTREGESYPKTRALGTGAKKPRHNVQIQAQRVRHRFESFRPGRPSWLRKIELVFDTAGPYSSKHGLSWQIEKFGRGVKRKGGTLPAGSFEDSRDHVLSEYGPRRRRGYKVRRIVQTAIDVGTSWFASLRRVDDTLYRIYKVATAMYAEQGAAAVSIDTGWAQYEMPTSAILGNQLVICTGTRRKKWNGSSSAVQTLGVTAPAAPTAATTVGTLSGTYYYAYTEYDPTTGDESAAGFLATPISPAAQGVTLTLAATSSDTRFSKRRIYRTTNGGTSPDLFLIATINTATSYTDSGAVDGTDPLDHFTDADGNNPVFVTGDLPDTFAIVCQHKGRLFYTAGATNGDRIYPTEPGETQRFVSTSYLKADGGVVRALVSHEGRLVAFTESTVEIWESDWIRREDGTLDYVHTVLSYTSGCVGPQAAVTVEGRLFWMDRRGIWTLNGAGRPERISDDIEDLFPYVNHGIANRIVGTYNHVRRQVCFLVPMASTLFQADSSVKETWFVASVDAPTEWFFYNLAASYAAPFDDDLNGLQFGSIDALGVFKQMETYEGDGAEGNEAFTTEDEGTDDGVSSLGISSISGQVVTVYGSPGWTSGALRGMSVVFRDRSTGLLTKHLISTNGTNTLTVVGTPSTALAARDGYYIGGMLGFAQLAEDDLKSPNRKVLRVVQSEWADLTGTLYS